MSYSIFNRAKDIPYNEQIDINNYTSAFNLGTETINWTTLNQYRNRNDVMCAKFLMYLKEMIAQTESMWKQEVIDKLDEMINNFFKHWIVMAYDQRSQHVSSSSKKYIVGDIVWDASDSTLYYICIKDCTGSAQLTNKTYWQPIKVKGEDSDRVLGDGTRNNWRGAYNELDGMVLSAGDVFYKDWGTNVTLYRSNTSKTIHASDPSNVSGITILSVIDRSKYNAYDSMPDNFEFPYNNPFGVMMDGHVYETIDGEHSADGVKKLLISTDLNGVRLEDGDSLEDKLMGIVTKFNL